MKIYDSPLLFPVKPEAGKIMVLDETQVPFKEIYLEVRSIQEALTVLREMKTRSLGQVLLFFYSCELFRKEHTPDQIAFQFSRERPTFDFRTLSYILQSRVGGGVTLRDAVDNLVYMLDKARRQRAQTLAAMLPAAASILTICNLNGELLYLYQELQNLNKTAEFYVSETRPYLQGTRLTFWELSANGVPARVVCDNRIAYLMSRGQVNCLVVGADRATVKGDIINKTGTYAAARLAGYFHIPFYALTQYPKDIDIDNIEIEERPPQETFMFLMGGISYEAVYPAFDVTRSEYITKCLELPMR